MPFCAGPAIVTRAPAGMTVMMPALLLGPLRRFRPSDGSTTAVPEGGGEGVPASVAAPLLSAPLATIAVPLIAMYSPSAKPLWPLYTTGNQIPFCAAPTIDTWAPVGITASTGYDVSGPARKLRPSGEVTIPG